MADNMEDLLSNVKKMVDSGNIPPEVQQMMNNLQNQNNTNSNNNSNNNNSNNADLNNILSQVSPEMLNNLSSMFQNGNNSSNNGSANSSNSSGFNLDMNTMLKMKNIISSMNQKDDPRANLLYSLKPYLRDSKKDKLDQYVNMLNMTKIADFMKNDNKENNNHV